MKPRITVITLGVDDVARSVAFYRDGLGFSTEGILGEATDENGQVAFFDLQTGLKLALYGRVFLAKDAHIPTGPRSSTEMSLGHNVASRQAVNDTVQHARQCGATVVKDPQDTFWGGYAGYFQDPDGHLWEVAWNPHWPMPD